MIGYHSPHVQILDTNYIKPAHKTSSEFVFNFSHRIMISAVHVTTCGATDPDRTDDLEITNFALYQLSYGGISWWAIEDLNF